MLLLSHLHICLGVGLCHHKSSYSKRKNHINSISFTITDCSCFLTAFYTQGESGKTVQCVLDLPYKRLNLSPRMQEVNFLYVYMLYDICIRHVRKIPIPACMCKCRDFPKLNTTVQSAPRSRNRTLSAPTSLTCVLFQSDQQNTTSCIQVV